MGAQRTDSTQVFLAKTWALPSSRGFLSPLYGKMQGAGCIKKLWKWSSRGNFQGRNSGKDMGGKEAGEVKGDKERFSSFPIQGNLGAHLKCSFPDPAPKNSDAGGLGQCQKSCTLKKHLSDSYLGIVSDLTLKNTLCHRKPLSPLFGLCLPAPFRSSQWSHLHTFPAMEMNSHFINFS